MSRIRRLQRDAKRLAGHPSARDDTTTPPEEIAVIPEPKLDGTPEPPPLTCGTCKHWHRKPTDAMALGEPARGLCREAPPAATTMQATDGRGRVIGTVSMSSYPDLPENFIACSRHAARVSLATV